MSGTKKKKRHWFSWLVTTVEGQSSQETRGNGTIVENTPEAKAASLIKKRDFIEAEAIYRALIHEGSTNHTVYGNLAAIYGMQKKNDEFIRLLKTAIEINPLYAEAHSNLGYALKEQGDLDGAISSCKKAIKIKPEYAEAYLNLGEAQKEKGELDSAISSYKRAVHLQPNNAMFLFNLGTTLFEKGDTAMAIATLKEAIKIDPNDEDAYINLGNSLKAQGNLQMAITYYSKSLEINENRADAHFALSLAQLLSGDYRRGLCEYEWRLKRGKRHPLLYALPKCRMWQGEKLESGLKLLLVAEQGLGDTMQFIRYALDLRQKGINVAVCAQPKLHALIENSLGGMKVFTREDAEKLTEGKWIPLLSLPKHLGVSPLDPIISKSYIKPKEIDVVKWRKKLENEDRPIIGINWQGNPEIEKNEMNGRSIKLNMFKDIAMTGKYSLLSLQKYHGSEQLENCNFKHRFVECQDQISSTFDFLETAAIISCCDIVITTDTCIAHLSGAMGKTTWLLLKKIPDWRWGLEGETTFWYPSIRIFRQEKPGDWILVMQQVKNTLNHYFSTKS